MRTLGVNVKVLLGHSKCMWLCAALVTMWVFSFHFINPWDILSSSTSANTVVFIGIPAQLVILNVELSDSFQTALITRMGSTEEWWWSHVSAAGVVAFVMSAGLAGVAVAVPAIAGRWTWRWGSYGRGSVTPAVLGHYPWTVPWQWSIDALLYLCLGLWAVGVLRHALSLWWRRPWLAWVAVVAIGLGSRALSQTSLQSVVWWLPGTQFSYAYHWGSYGSYALGWTAGYTGLVLVASALFGVWLVRNCDRRPAHGEGL